MTTTHAPPRPVRPSHLGSSSTFVRSLDVEWAALRTSRRALRTARTWVVSVPQGHPLSQVVGDLHDLEQLLAATQRRAGEPQRDDEMLLALVRLARTDDLAGRVVLQHLLPGLIDQSKRYRSFREPTDPMELAVPMAWIAIRSYDTERRIRHVASSLLSDALFQAFRRPLRRRSATEEVCAPSTFASTPCQTHQRPRSTNS